MKRLKDDTNLMYLPEYEHAACGMGFIAQVDGHASHEIVEKALTMLQRMNHRGGTGAEPDTGDGAGILMAMPDAFFRDEMTQAGLTLPAKGDYAVAQLFLPHDEAKKAAMLQAVVDQIDDAGFPILGPVMCRLFMKIAARLRNKQCRVLFRLWCNVRLTQRPGVNLRIIYMRYAASWKRPLIGNQCTFVLFPVAR